MSCAECSWRPKPDWADRFPFPFLEYQPDVPFELLRHNPDVAGTGVLAGFMGPAFLTVIVLIVYYCLGFHPEDPHLQLGPEQIACTPTSIGSLARARISSTAVHESLIPTRYPRRPRVDAFDENEAIDRLVNPIDRIIQRYPRRISIQRIKWQLTFAKIILMLGNTQLLTGIAILGSAFSQLKCGGISAYHWQIALYLAWLASVSHTSTLIILRDYLRNRPFLLWLRIFFMFALNSLLSVALLPTGLGIWLNVNVWPIRCVEDIESPPQYLPEPSDIIGGVKVCYSTAHYYPGASVKCFYTVYWLGSLTTEASKGTFPLMAISIMFLWLSFTTRAAKVVAQTSSWLHTCTTIIGNTVRRMLFLLHPWHNPQARFITVCQFTLIWPALSLYAMCKAWIDLYNSMLFEIFWLLIALIWGTYRIIGTRSTVSDTDFKDASMQEENTLTFGQWISFLLLLIPIYSIIEMITEATKQQQDDKPLDLTTLRESARDIYLGLETTTKGYYDRDWYKESWFLGLIVLEFAIAVQFVAAVFWLTRVDGFGLDWSNAVSNLTLWASTTMPISLSVYALVFFGLQDSSYVLDRKWAGKVKVILLVGPGCAVALILIITSWWFFCPSKGH